MEQARPNKESQVSWIGRDLARTRLLVSLIEMWSLTRVIEQRASTRPSSYLSKRHN